MRVVHCDHIHDDVHKRSLLEVDCGAVTLVLGPTTVGKWRVRLNQQATRNGAISKENGIILLR